MQEQSQTNRLASEDFIHLKENPHPSSRIAIARKIAQHINAAHPNTVEYDLACDIAQYLQRDEHIEVRITLAEALADSVQAPYELIVSLANDNETRVAVPVLKHSPILEESDLQAILEKTHEPQKLVAVASRSYVSVTISTRLVGFEMELVTLTLLENQGAQITEKLCKHIAKSFGNHTAIRRSLAERIPNAMKDEEVMQFQPMPEQDNHFYQPIPSFTEISEARLKNDVLTLLLLGSKPDAAMCRQLAEDMMQRQKLNGPLLLASLMIGNIPFFHAALSLVTGLSQEEVAHRCNAGREEFMVVYHKTSLSTSLLDLSYWLYSASDKLQKRGERSNSSAFIRLMDRQLQEAEKRSMNFAKTVGRQLMRTVEQIISA